MNGVAVSKLGVDASLESGLEKAPHLRLLPDIDTTERYLGVEYDSILNAYVEPEISFTRNEHILLRYILTNPGSVVSQKYLKEQVVENPKHFSKMKLATLITKVGRTQLNDAFVVEGSRNGTAITFFPERLAAVALKRQVPEATKTSTPESTPVEVTKPKTEKQSTELKVAKVKKQPTAVSKKVTAKKSSIRRPVQKTVFDMTKGACHNTKPDLFAPERGEDTTDAKQACHSCCMEDVCLEYAIKNRERGIWGGTSERERRKIIRERAQAQKAAI